MKRFMLLIFAFFSLFVSPVPAQDRAIEDELRAELAKLKEHVARVESILARLEAQRAGVALASAGLPAAAASSQVPASQEKPPAPAPPPFLAPALNTPPMLPLREDGFKKAPPRLDVLLQVRGDFFADTTRFDTFFLRKAEVGLKGQISRNVDFVMELDLVRPNDPYRRTYIRFTHFRRLFLKLGLEKAPIGLEELTSTAQIPFVDRSEVTDRFAAAEELGAHFESHWDRWLLQFSVTNGGRRLLRDDNKRKDVSARVVFAPYRNVSLGIATLRGRTGPNSLLRDRYNAEFKIGTNLTGFQSEFFRARDDSTWSSAFYTSLFWAIPVHQSWLTHVQPVFRYEFIGRSDRNPLEEVRLATFGFSFLFDGNRSKFQVNYLKDLHTGSRRDALRAQYQVEF